jgi:hypothetical protein
VNVCLLQVAAVIGVDNVDMTMFTGIMLSCQV